MDWHETEVTADRGASWRMRVCVKNDGAVETGERTLPIISSLHSDAVEEISSVHPPKRRGDSYPAFLLVYPESSQNTPQTHHGGFLRFASSRRMSSGAWEIHRDRMEAAGRSAAFLSRRRGQSRRVRLAHKVEEKCRMTLQMPYALQHLTGRRMLTSP